MRCPHCCLDQSEAADNLCKRCGKDMRTAPETPPATIPDVEADSAMVLGLFESGALDEDAMDAALETLYGPKEWMKWVDRMLLGLGAALILAGVIFFFAFNWDKITPFEKFGLIGLGIAACAVAAFFKGLDKFPGKILLTGAAVLVGVFLAVFGQVYQTGADAYQLFLGWLELVLLWVLISRFAGLWLLGIILLNAALLAYGTQVALPNDAWTASGMFLLMASVDACLLGLFEWMGSRGTAWIIPPWMRQLLLDAALLFLTIPAFLFIVEDFEQAEKTTLWALPAFFLSVGAACVFYFKNKSIASLASCTLASSVIILSIIGRIIFNSPREAAWQFLLFGVIVIAVSGGAAFLLIHVAKRMKEGASRE